MKFHGVLMLLGGEVDVEMIKVVVVQYLQQKEKVNRWMVVLVVVVVVGCW